MYKVPRYLPYDQRVFRSAFLTLKVYKHDRRDFQEGAKGDTYLPH